MTDPSFDLERTRLEAAQRHLPAHLFEEFQRLAKSVLYGPAFQLLFIDCPDERLRERVIAALDEVARVARLRTVRLPLGRAKDVAALEVRLERQAANHELVHLLGGPAWFDDARWDALNARRERLAEKARMRLLLWLDSAAIAAAARAALDLWAWRGGIYTFAGSIAASAAAPVATRGLAERELDQRTMRERHQRIATLRDWLAADPPPDDDLRVGLLDELGRLLYDVGDYDAALAHWRKVELPLHRRRGDERAAAITMSQIADVLQARGQLDEALRIWRDELLPVYEKLGDVRTRAVTMGRIADVLQARGQLDEALRIRRDEQLPVYEKVGDERARAVTMGKIADVLQRRGQLDEALRIRRDELLPVYEKLGDVRARALTMGRIADVLQARGQLDEALRIRRDEELPVFEKLGDVRERAVTVGRIAEVLQARGQIDEALRILRDEQLPVFERLGDVRELLVGRVNLALTLIARDGRAGAEAEALLRPALSDALRLQLPEAAQIEDILRKQGLDPQAPRESAGRAS